MTTSDRAAITPPGGEMISDSLIEDHARQVTLCAATKAGHPCFGCASLVGGAMEGLKALNSRPTEPSFESANDEWFKQGCLWCGGRHLGLDCPNRPNPRRPPRADPAEQRLIEGGRLMLEAEMLGMRPYYCSGEDDDEDGDDEDEGGADQSCKQDDGKTRWGLLLAHMPKALEKCVEVRAYGESKYGTSESWKAVEPERYLEAAQRHVMALFAGERVNVKDGNCHHAAQAVVDLLFFLENELRRERESAP